MSDAGKVSIYSLEETAWGTTPAAAMNTVAAANSATGGIEPSTVKSNVLRGDYVKPDTIRVQDGGGLTVPFEAQYGDVPFSDWLEGVMRSDWTAAASVTATDISFASADNSMSSTAQTLTVFPIGSWVRVTGSTSNDGFHYVTISTTAKLTFGPQSTVVTEAASASITVDNDGKLQNGSTLKSYTIERHFTDATTLPFLAQPGLRPSAWSLTVPTGGLVTGSCQFAGKKPNVYAAATAGTGAANAKTTTKTFSGSAHIFAVFEGGVAVTAKVSEIGVNLSSPVRPQYEVGQISPWGVGGNSFEWTGNLNVYNNDAGAALWNKLHADTATSLYFRLTRDSTTYIFSMPNIRLTGGNPDVGSVDSDVMLPLSFAIDYSSTYSMLMSLNRFAAS